MRRLVLIITVFALAFALAAPAVAGGDMAVKLDKELRKAFQMGHWQVKAPQVAQWIKEGKKHFQIVDVRPDVKMFKAGHIPGAIYIRYNDILRPENLKKLPKDKMLILVCVTGQTQNLPVLALRVLGYDAWTMSLGHAAWIKDYFGGKIMQGAIYGASKGNYPLVR